MKKRIGASKAVLARLKKIPGFTVSAKRCEECLFSSNRLVDKKRAAEIIRGCRQDETYFVCHKFQVGKGGGMYSSESVCCRAFYDTQPTQPIRMAERMGIIKFVDQEGNVVEDGA